MIFIYPDLKAMCFNIKVKKTLQNLSTSDVVGSGKQYYQYRIFDSDGRTCQIVLKKITYLLLKKTLFK